MSTTAARDGAQRARMTSLVRRAAILVVACGVAGAIAGGIGARIVMRVVAVAAPEARGRITENGNVVGDITLAGTLTLGFFAGVGSALFGVGMAVVARPWLPQRWLSRGVVFGAILLLFLGGGVIDPANPDFVVLPNAPLNVAMFASLFILFGVVASWAEARLDERFLVGPSTVRGYLVAGPIALLVLPGIASIVLVQWRGLVLAGASMLFAARSGRRGDHPGAAAVLRIAATAAFVLVLISSGLGLLDGVYTIVRAR